MVIRSSQLELLKSIASRLVTQSLIVDSSVAKSANEMIFHAIYNRDGT